MAVLLLAGQTHLVPALAKERAHAKPATTTAEPTTEAPPPNDDPPPADAPAQAHFNYARQMFARQEFLAAAKAMELAYARDPRPLYLFNEAQAYRKGSRYNEAIATYERFLVEAPQNPLAPDARDHIRTLKLIVEQSDHQKQIELTMEQTQQELLRAKTEKPIYKRAWFWATIGGVAVAAIAIGVGVKIYNDQRATETGTLSLQF